MYKEHFGFKELPFSIAPDPRFLYMSSQHREAMAHLVYGLNTDGGFVMLTGDVGTGKTTICRCLLEQTHENTDVAFILNPRMTAEELLATLCDELGIRYPEGNNSVKVFVDNINAYLLDAYAGGRKTVLIIEEAQNLLPDVLEQVRLLTNLETNQQKLLKIIMIGQPQLREMLLRPDMEQLSQRVTARCHIGPLPAGEIGAYINHRLSVAGARNSPFSESEMRKLHKLSRGVPRLINVICDRALLGAYVQGIDTVDKKTLAKAAREVFGQVSGAERRSRLLKLASGLLILCLGTIVTAFYGNVYKHYDRAKVQSAQAVVKTTEVVPVKETFAGNPHVTWPTIQSADRSRELAYEALFKEWNISYQTQKGDSVCKQAASKGLRCLDGSATLRELVGLNRPAVLKLFSDKEKEFYATIRRVDGQNAVLIVGKETMTVGLKEVEQRWLGEYHLLWRAPDAYSAVIRPGDKVPETGWFGRYLSAMQSKKAHRSPLVYNNDLVGRVKKFQLNEGIMPDGVIGPQTVIHLLKSKGTKEPLLTTRNGGTK